MGKQLANKIRGKNLQAGGGVLLFIALLFSFACALSPSLVQAATVTYGLRTDATTALGADGTCNMTQTIAPTAKTTMVTPATTVATSYRPTTGMTQGTPVTLVRAYGPVYASAQTITAPSGSFAIRGYNATDTWTFHVYSYNPAGAANNKTLMYSSNTVTSGTGATVVVTPTYTLVNSAMPASSRLLVEVVYTPGGALLTPRVYLDGTANTTWSRLTVTETAATGDTTPPTDGAAPTATANSSSQITLNWSAATDAGVGLHATLPYIVKYNLGATPPAANCTNGTQIYNGTARTYAHASLLAGTQYSYRICAQDANLNVSTGVTATATTTASGGTVTRSANWTSQYASATYPAGTINAAYTIAAGTNRLLVVAIASTRTAVGTQTVTAPTWGGRPLTLAAGDATNASTWSHTYIYYLKEADIAAASGSALTLTIAGGTSYYTRVYAAVYTGVDQTTPLNDAKNWFTNTGATLTTAVGPFSPTLAVGANNQAVEIVNLARSAAATTARTITTWATGWTTAGQAPAAIVTTGPTQQVYIRDRAVPTAVANDGSQHVASSANSWNSMTAIAIRPSTSGITLTTGSTVASQSVYAGDAAKAVDAFTMQATVADTVTSIQVTGSANCNNANVSALRIYRKVGTNNAIYEAGDVQIASVTNPFSGGTVANVAVNEPVSTAKNYVIVFDVAATAVPTNTLTANVTAITATNAATVTDPVASSGTLTIYATVTVGTGTEPATVRLWKSSAATNLNAFTLVHNGSAADNDTISTVTVTLTPQYISGGSGGTLSKIKLLEVTNAAGNVVYGSMTAATTGDIWNVPTPTLVATSTPTTYYVRVSTADAITPSIADTSGTPEGFYSFSGTVTALTHSKATNKLVLGDTAGQTLTIDVEKPLGPATATATTGSIGGSIDLIWDAGSDANGGALNATTPYIVVRSAPDGTQPNPGCVDGTPLTLSPVNQSSRSFTDTGLIDTTPTRYYYRVCTKDQQGNVSDGATSYTNAKVTNVCFNPPTISLTAEDGLSTMQIVKSANSSPFKLQVANNDIGTCPDVNFTANLANEVNSAHFDKNLAGAAFPATITLGTGGSGASTGKTLNLFVTGRPEANQLEQYKFAVQISSPGNNHGSPLTTQQVTALLNDMPPIVHNSNNMAKYQYGNWGQTFTCATCHSNSTTNIKGIYQIISTPIGRRNVVFNKISGVSTDYTGVYGNDLRPVKNVSTNVCEVCHHKTRQHQYSANKTLAGPNGDEPYVSDHHNGRDCVKCHTHNTAFRSIYGVCGDCHGFKATGYSPINKGTMVKDMTNALGPNPPNYGAHARHNTARLTCAACHSNTNHGLDTTAWLGNNNLEIGFSINKDSFTGFNPNASITGGTFYGTNNLNQPYVWSAGPGTTIIPIADYNASCNTYCHGAWSGNGGNNTTPIWVGSGQVACGGCHNATGAVPPSAGSHTKHAGTTAGGLGIACDKCHATYGSYTGSAHINGKVEWNLSAYPGATYNGANASSTNAPAPTATINYGQCSNLYCHSNVQGAGGVGSPTYYAQPTWGDPDTATCGSCHAYPNNIGGHIQHENTEVAFDCHVCHNNGGTTSPQNHAKGTINFEFVGLGQNTVYSLGNTVTPGTAYGTCSASNCHGRYTRAWGPPTATPLCEKCHGSRTSARGFYNTRGPSGTLSIYSAGIGVHDIHLQNLNSPRKSTFSRFTSYALGYNCNQCHNTPSGPFTAGHMDTPLPAEAQFAHISSIADRGNSFGYYSTPTFTSATQSCSAVWCHGAGMNSNSKRGPYAGVNPAINRQNPAWNVPYLTGNGNTDCNKCHALPPPAPNSSYTHFGKTLSSCSSCHQHVGADGLSFKQKSLHVNGSIDGGCTNCHGNPPVTNVVGASDGLASPKQNALIGGTAGAHNAHVLNANIGNDCGTCHYNYDPTMPSNKLEIGFNGYNGTVVSGTFNGYTNTVNGPKWQANSAPGGTTTIVKVNAAGNPNHCSNLYCHGGGTATLPAIGGGSNTSPDWEGGSTQAECGACHGTSAASVPTKGSHVRHAGNGVGGLSLSCDTCHGTASNNMTHVDGKVSWDLNKANIKIGSTATYNNASSGTIVGLAPRNNGADYRYCNNVYCHSNVQGTNGVGSPTSYQSIQWGGTGLTCSSCHSAMSSGAATGSHAQHAQSAGYACGVCHHDGGHDADTHADGLIYTNFTSTVGGTYSNDGRVAGSAAGYGTCSATACHGTVSPQWGYASGKPKCEICHGFRKTPWNALNGATATTDAKVGTHFNHISSNAAVPKLAKTLSCLECHSDSISNSTDSVAATNHMNNAGTTKVKFAALGNKAAGGGTYAASTCSNVYCHGATLSGAAGRTNPVWNTPFLNGVASNDCTKCHGYPPQISAHIKTQPSTYYGPTECVNCHKHVNANGDGFTDPSLHINGNIEGGDCLSCHQSVQGKRAAVVGQFASQSHHIQGSEQLTTAQCYKCHWEANSDGSVNATYHDKGQSANAGVSLVIWNGTTRPTTATMGTTYISYTANGTRSQIAKLNFVCLGCHNTANQTITPFGKYSTHRYSPEARLLAPKAKTSIQSRYSSTRTVAWSNYIFNNNSGNVAQYGTNMKSKITKALSAHGNAVKNQFPVWDGSLNGKGEDETMADAAASATLSANRNVFCYDCHNSHGSEAAGITSSYSSATGRNKGGLLKTTKAGQGGYTVDYTPAARTITYRNYSSKAQAAVTTSTATVNTGASICNDCHNNDTRKVNISKPWSITGTYSSTKAIVGYWSTPYFDNYTVTSTKRSAYKAGGAVNAVNDRRKPMGGHFGSSVSTRSAAHAGEINGLCTPCHDPHGVSNALSTDRDHGVPLLKGTWVTSPYLEDKAGQLVKRGGGSKFAGITNGGAAPGYHIDQNTFMSSPAPVNGGAGTATTRSNKRSQRFRSFNVLSSAQTGTNYPNLAPATFGGLCMECHSQQSLTGSSTNTTSAPWLSKERVHQTVSGWASTNGTNTANKVHAYTCAKCHAPHVSRLPRLLVTNCIDSNHFGQSVATSIASTGASTTTPGNIIQSTLTSSANGAGRFPGGGSRYSNTPGSAQNSGGWWFQTNGAAGTTQPNNTPSYGSACHNAANAGGATYSPVNQKWNRKSQW